MTELSVVILTCNSAQWIKPCLQSLCDTITVTPTEWIVVDNASTDNSQQIVSELIPHALLIQNSKNLGVARARNIGIKQASGKFVLLIDDDTCALPGAIDQLYHYLENHPQCGIVGPQLENPDGSLQANALPLPSISVKTKRIIGKLFSRQTNNPYIQNINKKEPFSPGYLIGACQMIRHSTIDSVGLLDEKIFYGPEDADFCIRMAQADFEVTCLPKARVIHAYQRQSYKLKKFKLLSIHFKSLVYFWWKHKWLVAKNPSRG
jgi:GT2 family glycosyltransferase